MVLEGAKPADHKRFHCEAQATQAQVKTEQS